MGTKASGRRIIPQAQWDKYAQHRAEGMTLAKAAAAAGISVSTVERAHERGQLPPPVPVPLHRLCAEAKRALNDFAYFRARYFGRVTVPWQIDAANRIAQLLDTDNKEFLVVNCPPGSGKTTVFPHDLVCWVLCRNRATRILLGSRTQRQADALVGRLRRTLERNEPVVADERDIRLGRAQNAESTLIKDYGRFRPTNAEQWRTSQFIVLQHRGQAIADKECSVGAYGLDGPYLGQRFNLVIWDDLVDSKNLRTLETRERLEDKWEDECETRLEPGGLLVLQGQRMGTDDLYRYTLNKTVPPDEDDPDGQPTPMFEHVTYKAHYPDLCTGTHKNVKAYPQGCLLDPVRLPWRDLAAIQTNRAGKYAVLYQQEDTDPADVLVPHVWITGGTDPTTGEQFPGCWDNDRDTWQLPNGLSSPRLTVITADPSPARYWAVQAWCYHAPSEQRFLLDSYRGVMDAPDFLDWNQNQGCFYGLLDEWWHKAKALGAPVSHVIVENNAAQRFLLQYDHVQRWQRLRGVVVMGHATHSNKSDPDYGVQTLAPHYRYGRVRLPGKQKTQARPISLQLVNEVTRWPHGSTDDQVMAHWFLEWNLPRLHIPSSVPPKFNRPTFMRNVRSRVGASRSVA